ncbi:MAG TPA: hypothetical protein VF173_18190 [Thermoanaerobaculia bacterium]|nr:hypothetical protein [Thermoanaerobaculia bacterium]
MVHPQNGLIVYALPREGPIRRSSDGGATWTDLSPNSPRNVTALKIDPQSPNVLYAQTFNGPVPFKSVDGGRTWTGIGQGLAPEVRVRELVIDPVFPQRLYLTQATSSAGRGFFRSLDGGATWAPLASGLGGGLPVLLGAVPGRPQSDLFGTVQGRLYRSVDGGQTWLEVGPELPKPIVPTLAVTGHGLFLGTYQGVYRSTDGGTSWVLGSRGLNGNFVRGLAAGSSLVAGTQNSGLFASEDGGAAWRRLPLEGLAPQDTPLVLGPVVFPPGDPQRIYVSVDQGIARSEDAGASWSISSIDSLWAEKIVVDPTHSDVLYVAGNTMAPGPYVTGQVICGLQKSVDGGRSWSCLRDRLPGGEISVLALDPRQPSTLYARVANALYRSADGGGSWQLLPSFPLELAPRALAFPPGNPATIYSGVYGGVARSTNGGQTWTRFTRGLPEHDAILDVEIDPVEPATLYAMSSASGVFKSTDAGKTWTFLGPGLEGTFAETLRLDPQDRSTLYVATRGSGVLKLTQQRGGAADSAPTASDPHR